MAENKYVIRGGVEGRERLRLLADVMGASTRALLAQAGVVPGGSCLDIGCGGGDVTFDLARAVGARGRVLGVDLDETKMVMARREADERCIPNVSFEVRNVLQWQPGELFDVVYARFLLSHLPDPGALLRAVHRYTRPGGVVILEDVDFRGHFAQPPCPALDRFVEVYSKSVRARGADPDIGPRLPALLRDAGFEDVQMRLHHPATQSGGIKLLTCVTLENIAEAVVSDGWITDGELRQSIEQLYAFARDSTTVLGGPRVFQAWGRRMENPR